MYMTKYDLYDIYVVIVYIRAYINDEKNTEILRAVKRLLDEPQAREDFNSVRHAISAIDGVDSCHWNWAFNANYYTYIPPSIKDEIVYRVLSACFDKMIFYAESGNIRWLFRVANATHNLPIIFAENDIKEAMEIVENEIWYYRMRYDDDFLKDLI